LPLRCRQLAKNDAGFLCLAAGVFIAGMAAGSARQGRAGEGELRALSAGELPTLTIELAKFLLGKILVHDGGDGRVSGRIVETEAYPPGDDAGHARSGHTRRNASLFLQAGHVYVYRAYGISMMLNISSEVEGVGAGVLIRAVEPITGIDIMHRRRGVDDVYRLTRGPGCLTQAFAIDLSLDGTTYARGNPLWLADDGTSARKIGSSVRIGITRNADKRWRYFVRGNRWVSGPARLNAEP
jgi:DNA-3-methyladenine glycosylase